MTETDSRSFYGKVSRTTSVQRNWGRLSAVSVRQYCAVDCGAANRTGPPRTWLDWCHSTRLIQLGSLQMWCVDCRCQANTTLFRHDIKSLSFSQHRLRFLKRKLEQYQVSGTLVPEQTAKSWSSSENEILTSSRAEKLTYRETARRLGRSVNAVKAQWAKLSRRRKPPSGLEPPKTTEGPSRVGHKWTMEEDQLMWRLRTERKAFPFIAATLDRSLAGTRKHWNYYVRYQNHESRPDTGT